MESRLVPLQSVDPHLAGPIDVARSHLTDFCRPATCKPLNAHHVGNCFGQERDRDVNNRVIDGLYESWLAS
jgi:hypothetical protein